MDLEEQLQDIFYIPRIMGNFPFDCQFRLSKKLLAYCCFLRFLSAFCLAYSLTKPSSILAEEYEEFSLDVALKCAASFSDLAENFFSILWWVLKQHRVSYMIKSIKETQRRKKITLVRQYIRLTHYLLLLTTILSILAYLSWGTKDEGLAFIFVLISYSLISNSTICFVGQFWDILRLLALLFREGTQLFDESSVINYGRFLSICEMANDIYGLQLLYTITQLFLKIIVCLYALLLPVYPILSVQSLLRLTIVAYCIVCISSIILACCYFQKQERNFNDDLRRRMIEDKSRVLLRNEKLNFHFLVGQETVFTACGFFKIDMPLICSMISATTTYLVIVLQFGSDKHRLPTKISNENIYNIEYM